MSRSRFASRVFAWAREHGRRDLPWQRRPTPYRVWVSEIMLQQTQVSTVIPYFQRFVARFPSVRALADAPVDDVLTLWSGLGYYARARHLHRAAQTVAGELGGRLPRTREGLMALPGIGRSTAGAIRALAAGERHAILDGNVKRLLARHAGVDGWPGETAVEKRLWDEAEARLPHRDVAAYTQGVMDLGALVCRPREPACGACPVRADCVARIEQRTGELPARRPRRRLPERATTWLLLRDGDGALLLERRPPSGVWGGLWCPPECADPASVGRRLDDLGLTARRDARGLAPMVHTFSHFRLHIRPLLLDVLPRSDRVNDPRSTRWLQPAEADGVALAAPVARLVASVARETS